MNGERAQINGERSLKDATYARSHISQGDVQQRSQVDFRHDPGHGLDIAKPHLNGNAEQGGHLNADQKSATDVALSLSESLNLIDQDAYLPLARLIHRTAQTCWNGLSSIVDQLSIISVPPQPPDPSNPLTPTNNQTKANLDKKDRILNFANDEKANFIKLLVLLQWSKGAEDVTKTIELNYWLMQRRLGFWDAIQEVARLKNDSVGFQLPNPDLRTAAQILSTGCASNISDLGYSAIRPLSSKQILQTLNRLNKQLCIRFASQEQLPSHLQRFYIHDGRATLIVEDEFELDVSIMNELPTTPFRVLDVRFLFEPPPTFTESLRAEIYIFGNLNIDRA